MNEDQETAGRVLLTSYYTVVPISFTFIGVQLVICSFGQILFGESSKEDRKDRRLYIICSWLILILYALSQVADTAEVYLLMMNASTAVDALTRVKPQIAQQWWRQWVTGICLSICNWIGDGLLVWRCYIVWSDYRVVCLIPCITYVAQVALCIVSGVFLHMPNKTPATLLLQVQTLQAWIFLSVSVNCMVTGLISWRLFRVRNELAGILSREDLRIYLGVVAILVESALPLALSGIAFAALSRVQAVPRNRAGKNIALLLWFSFNALSPQMIIFRVTTGRSWVGRPSHLGPSRTCGGVSTRIHFSQPEGSEAATEVPPPSEACLDANQKESNSGESVLDMRRGFDAQV